jgi:hypothetical protein
VVIRLLTLCFSLVCLAVFVWFGVTVDLGDRTLFGHLRAIGSSREAKDLWDGTKSKLNDFIGIEAAKRAEAAKRRPVVEKVGPPQEDLSARDHKQMQDQVQRLTEGAKRNGVQGRSPPRKVEPRSEPRPVPKPEQKVQILRAPAQKPL